MISLEVPLLVPGAVASPAVAAVLLLRGRRRLPALALPSADVVVSDD